MNYNEEITNILNKEYILGKNIMLNKDNGLATLF